eukprot:GABV01007821.1.p1 GENE.GABV01007821.1~~GABV01007821.1.p1  ORF type:complete len:120 (-),score=22.73 GABV01007821.1:3-362(-)
MTANATWGRMYRSRWPRLMQNIRHQQENWLAPQTFKFIFFPCHTNANRLIFGQATGFGWSIQIQHIHLHFLEKWTKKMAQNDHFEFLGGQQDRVPNVRFQQALPGHDSFSNRAFEPLDA